MLSVGGYEWAVVGAKGPLCRYSADGVFDCAIEYYGESVSSAQTMRCKGQS